MGDGPTKFQKLGLEESLNKLKLAVSGHALAEMEIWSRGEDGHRFAFMTIFEGVTATSDGRHLQVQGLGKLPSGQVMMCLTVGRVLYLALGSVNGGVLVLEEGLHRPEARAEGRFLAYPHHQCFAFFLVQEEDDSNVLSMNRSVQLRQGNFDHFKSENMRETLEAFGHQAPVQGKLLLELRVLDLSAQGLGVLANANEAELLKDRSLCFLSWNGEKLALGACRPIHQVPFLDARGPARGPEWLKVGLELATRSIEYENLLERHLDEKIKAVARGEFASYVERSKK